MSTTTADRGKSIKFIKCSNQSDDIGINFIIWNCHYYLPPLGFETVRGINVSPKPSI